MSEDIDFHFFSIPVTQLASDKVGSCGLDEVETQPFKETSYTTKRKDDYRKSLDEDKQSCSFGMLCKICFQGATSVN